MHRFRRGAVAGCFLFIFSGCVSTADGLSFGPLPDLDYAWAWCEVDEETGLTDPSCNPIPPVIFQVSAAVFGATGQPVEGQMVGITSDAPGILVVPRERVEAVLMPSDSVWTDGSLQDDVWAWFSGEVAGDAEPVFAEVETDADGVARLFVVIDDPTVDSAFRPVPSTLLVEADNLEAEIILTPLTGEGGR